MSDVENEGEWKWVDGSNVTITFWGTCQPDDAGVGEDCGVFNHKNGIVSDENCNKNRLSFICTCTNNATVSIEEDAPEEGIY